MTHVPFLVELLLAIEVIAAAAILIVYTLVRTFRRPRRTQRTSSRRINSP